MNPNQALQVLSQASQLAAMSAQDHQKCFEAAQVLSDAINPKELEEQCAQQQGCSTANRKPGRPPKA